MRLSIVIVGVALVIASFVVSPLGPASWIPFIVGFVMLGVGLMVDSPAKAAAKARVSRARKYNDH